MQRIPDGTKNYNKLCDLEIGNSKKPHIALLKEILIEIQLIDTFTQMRPHAHNHSLQ